MIVMFVPVIEPDTSSMKNMSTGEMVAESDVCAQVPHCPAPMQYGELVGHGCVVWDWPSEVQVAIVVVSAQLSVPGLQMSHCLPAASQSPVRQVCTYVNPVSPSLHFSSRSPLQ